MKVAIVTGGAGNIGKATAKLLAAEGAAVTVAGLGADAAAAEIATSDRNRRDYFQRFYDVAEELPTHYDLVINTEALTPDEAADIIVAAARRRA